MGGHNLSVLTYVLGPLSSVSATSTQLFGDITVVDDVNFVPTGETVKNLSDDQYSYSGVLKNSGAILTVVMRGGITTSQETDNDKPTFIWLIDGDKGYIRVEATGARGSHIYIGLPVKVVLNGEVIDVSAEQNLPSIIGKSFEEFAKGPGEGIYPSFDDAVKVHKHVEAIIQSAKEGRRVDIHL